MSIPAFFDNYHLPDGEHVCTMKEIERVFLFSEKRSNVWGKFLDLLSKLEELGLKYEYILIDGSFVTGREEPSDVDFGIYLPPYIIAEALTVLNDTEKELLKYFTDLNNQYEISQKFGAHLLIGHNDIMMEDISFCFREGLDSELRPPDPKRDPEWVSTPAAKGILKVIRQDGGESIERFDE
ncbi:hypothetical protein ABIC86_001763 [Paenibacillus sp. DS2363]|uniref:DUF6932 family protein n=1 Tax=unclassified Paenibacillus TaxID=185978 RepID=UPI0030F9FF4E